MFISAVYFVVLHPSGVGDVCKHDDYYHEVEIFTFRTIGDSAKYLPVV